MKKTIIGGVVAGGLMLGAAGLVIAAGIARADEHPMYGFEGDQNVQAFIPEMYPEGVYLTAAQAFQMAKNVCGEQAMGASREHEINVTKAQGYSSWYSIDSVMGAEWHFCPQFDSIHVPVPRTITSGWRSTVSTGEATRATRRVRRGLPSTSRPAGCRRS